MNILRSNISDTEAEASRPPALVPMSEVYRAWSTVTTVERRVAKDLAVDPDTVAASSMELWGRTFSEERDLRAGSNANAQKRGRVTREMKAQLERVISGAEPNPRE